jgi:ATP phosphoribosyltransferase regulatory subunit
MTHRSNLQIPSGVQCFYGREARLRKAVERVVGEVFSGWSYEEIIVPLFDYYDVFARGGGPSFTEHVYRFIGRDGELLALRPDFTALVAKVVASRMQERPVPLRLFYSGEVLRYQPPKAGQQKELFQIGLEHIGDGLAADLEVILVAIEALDRLGVTDAVLTLGHAGFVLGLLEELGVTEEARPELLEAMRLRQADRVGEALDGEPPDTLLAAMRLFGSADVLDRAQKVASHPDSAAALTRLRAISDELAVLGLGERVQFDLGEVRSFDYYTGMVFEIYAPGTGLELGGGGRYDSLLAKFGLPLPAVGFSLSLDRLAQKVAEDRLELSREDEPKTIAVGPKTSRALADALELRRQGKKVRIR